MKRSDAQRYFKTAFVDDCKCEHFLTVQVPRTVSSTLVTRAP